MGSPGYTHPSQPAPGHVVGLAWDSSVPKFGIDRRAGVWPDLGNPDKLRLSFELPNRPPNAAPPIPQQRLLDGLPIITTVFELNHVRYEMEQFAYPLNGPAAQRQGNIPLVLMQRLRLTNLDNKDTPATVLLIHERPVPSMTLNAAAPGNWLLQQTPSHAPLLSIQAPEARIDAQHTAQQPPTTRPAQKDPKPARSSLTLSLDLPATASRDLIIKLPSPTLAPDDALKLLQLDYDHARETTIRFWSDYLARGAQEPNVRIDLPYSNFAYGQDGTPWPINQSVYVDYMLYDLRGHHDLAVEELQTMYRNNQEPTGHVGGYANWVVYTPGMMYSVAQNFLLSGDRPSFDKLLPQTLKALDWCLAEIKRGSQRPGPSAGLVEGPLNDLTGVGVWAFNQAYVYAGLDMLGRALQRIDHPRAKECADAANAFRLSVERAFAAAAVQSPLVQLRDHTWTPYVPTESLTPGRMMSQWYPTDVDSGPMHLPRLKALRHDSLLTEFLLHDHEDNLFLHGWGMANEPVYNQHATVYLLRDKPKAAIRAFYSMMACAFSHSCFEPVEHRWTWGQYFGPPSTDGAWFELYRNMLIRELDDDSLLLLQATPRQWLEDGKTIEVERAPTYFGPLSMKIDSAAASNKITATIQMPQRTRPTALLLRLRHPDAKPMRKLTVNGRDWNDYDTRKEWLRIPQPAEAKYSAVVEY